MENHQNCVAHQAVNGQALSNRAVASIQERPVFTPERRSELGYQVGQL